MALKVESLTLRIDEPIKKASMKASAEIMAYSEDELEKSHVNYMQSIGGATNFLQIEEEKKLLRAGKSSVSSDVPTHMKTKALMESCESVKEIAKARVVTAATIMNHFSTLKKEDATLDLSKFKPKNLPVEAIEKVVVILEKEKNVEHFGDDGRLRFKPIFEALNGEISYDEIRATMLFRV
jgi:hypothetical protein